MAITPQRRRLLLDTGLHYSYLEWNPDASHTSTVVLIHGFLDIAWSWQPLVASTIGSRYHIVAPDMRGHGDSDWVGPGGYYHFPDYIADLNALIRHTARHKLFLVGHSMGGVIASYYAGTFPDSVLRLALLEGTGPEENTASMPDRVRSWISGWRRANETPNRHYQSTAHAAARLRKHDPLLDETMAQELAQHGTRVTSKGTVQFKHDPRHLAPNPYPFHVETAAQFWQQITCPVLLLDGSDSKFRTVVADSDHRRRRFLNAEHDTICGAGHRMHCHQPTATGSRLQEFLQD